MNSPTPRPDPTPVSSAASETRRVKRARAARRTAVLFGILFIGLVVLAGAFVALRQSIAWIDHTHETLTLVEQISASMTEAESGYQGYLLTHNDAPLQRYRDSKDRIEVLLHRAQDLMADNPTQQENLSVLRPLTARRLERFDRILRDADRDGIERALEAVRDGSGRELALHIRRVIAGMRAEEHDLLRQRGNWATLLEVLIGPARQVPCRRACGSPRTHETRAWPDSVVT